MTDTIKFQIIGNAYPGMPYKPDEIIEIKESEKGALSAWRGKVVDYPHLYRELNNNQPSPPVAVDAEALDNNICQKYYEQYAELRVTMNSRDAIYKILQSFASQSIPEEPDAHDIFYKGCNHALDVLESMYGSSNFQHNMNIVDCTKAKLNMLDIDKIRPSSQPVQESAGVWVKTSTPPKEEGEYHCRCGHRQDPSYTAKFIGTYLHGQWQLENDDIVNLEWLDQNPASLPSSGYTLQQMIEKRIVELNDADKSFCHDRWDNPDASELKKTIAREESNKVTFARQVLQDLLKAVSSSLPVPAASVPPRTVEFCLKGHGVITVQYRRDEGSEDANKMIAEIDEKRARLGDRYEYFYRFVDTPTYSPKAIPTLPTDEQIEEMLNYHFKKYFFSGGNKSEEDYTAKSTIKAATKAIRSLIGSAAPGQPGPRTIGDITATSSDKRY